MFFLEEMFARWAKIALLWVKWLVLKKSTYHNDHIPIYARIRKLSGIACPSPTHVTPLKPNIVDLVKLLLT